MRICTIDGGMRALCFPCIIDKHGPSVRRSRTGYIFSPDNESASDEDVGVVLDSSSEEDSDDVFMDNDSEFISEYTSNSPRIGYNMTERGMTNRTLLLS